MPVSRVPEVSDIYCILRTNMFTLRIECGIYYYMHSNIYHRVKHLSKCNYDHYQSTSSTERKKFLIILEQKVLGNMSRQYVQAICPGNMSRQYVQAICPGEFSELFFSQFQNLKLKAPRVVSQSTVSKKYQGNISSRFSCNSEASSRREVPSLLIVVSGSR